MNKIIITRPCSPSQIISHEEVEAEYFKLISGMSGGCEELYATDSKVIDKNFLHIVLLDGLPMKINVNFVVKTYNVKLVKLVTDITDHANYNTIHVVGKRRIKTQYILIGHNQEYEIDVDGLADTVLKSVYTDTIDK